jgi:hypothetical protein
MTCPVTTKGRSHGQCTDDIDSAETLTVPDNFESLSQKLSETDLC